MAHSTMPAKASSAESRVEVAVLDPTIMTLPEVYNLCVTEPALLKCDVVREGRRQQRQKKDLSKNGNIHRQKEQGRRYNVFNANFE